MQYKNKTFAVTLAALLLGSLPTAQAATAVVKPNITSVAVIGEVATVKWSSPKLPAKAYFEVEIKTRTTPVVTTVTRSTTTTIAKVLKPYSYYSVRVRSLAIAKGAWSGSKGFSTTGGAVNNVNVVETTHTSVQIAWEAPAGATGYEVMLGDGLVKTTQNNTYTFTGLKPGAVNKFSIRPVAGTIKGVATPFFEFTTLTTGPTNLNASNITSSSFTLSWTAITGADSYNVYQGTTFLGNSKTTSYPVKSLTPGLAADYSVQAVFGAAVTEASDKLNVTSLTEIPVAPTISQITSVSALVSWQLDLSATSYTVTLYDGLGTSVLATKSVNSSFGSTTFTGLSPLTSYSVGIVEVYPASASKSSLLTSFTTTKSDLGGLAITNITTTAGTLSWSSNPAAVTYEVLRDGTIIASGIAPSVLSYSFTALAPGNTYILGVRATYVNGAGATLRTDLQSMSFSTLVDQSFKPALTTAPVVTLPYALSPVVGATLTANAGIWTSVPAISAYTYQWQRSSDGGTTNFIDISGATTLSYTVTAADIGFPLRIRVTATNTNGTSSPQPSVATLAGVPGYNVTVPTVRGNFVVGQTLESTDGTWSSPYAITLSYQWKRDGVAITGSTAISPTYVVVAADIGTALTVTVTASTSQGSFSATSTSRGTVTAVNNTVLPTISGTVRVGSTLTLAQGTWLNASTITQQWQSSSDSATWNAIVGAGSTSYVLTTAESGLYVRAQVFGSFTSGSTSYKTTANTAATVVVPASNVTNSVLPVVSGTLAALSTLSTTTGTWSTSGTFTYQWQSSPDGSTWTNIASATGSTYVLTGTETGKYMRVQVTNSISSGAISGTAYSVATVKISAPSNTAIPVISGTLRIGSTQTTTNGTWTNSPSSFTYQWQSSNNGISWTNISGATAITYVPTFDICNAQIRVVVGAFGSVDTATVSSAAVSGFLPPAAPNALPTINDTNTVGSTFTVTAGVWPNTPNTTPGPFQTYQWERSADAGASWAVIAGATGISYVVVTGDSGYRFRVRETLTTNTGSSSTYTLTSLNPIV